MTTAMMYGAIVLDIMPSTAAVTDDAKNQTFILKYDDESDDRQTKTSIEPDIALYSSTYT